MLFRPATPGFLVTLAATILLALVSFSVPIVKSVYFLKAKVDFDGQSGTATFGVLGFCLQTPDGNSNCTTPRVGYEFDPNQLLGNKTRLQIPEVVVKWLTYALVLHIVALAFAAGSAVFGLLAHIREMSMACCSTCVSGFGAAVAMIAFIFDIAFFFLFKARINKVPGGSAQIGNAIWLTLAAWLLLFFAGCFYGFGRCCISNRPRGSKDKKYDPPENFETGRGEALRLDAVKAEADRKARQKQGEIGLPAFNEYDPSKPLTAKYDEEYEPYSDYPRRQPSTFSDAQPGGHVQSNHGYTPGAPGTTAMDAYNNVSASPPQSHPQIPAIAVTYPPQPSGHSQYQPSGHGQYPSSQYNATDGLNTQSNHELYPSAGTYNHRQYPSNITQQNAYGHQAQETSYYSTASHYQQPSYNAEPSAYNTGYTPTPSGDYNVYTPAVATALPAATSHDQGSRQNSNYTPSDDFMAHTTPAAMSMGRDDYSFSKSPSPIQTNASSTPAPGLASPTSRGPRGPRSPTSPTQMYSQQIPSDHPPGYDAGNGSTAPWPNEKR